MSDDDELEDWEKGPPPGLFDDVPAVGASAAQGLTAECSDLRNAERLVEWHGDELRHCHAWKKWLTWDGRRWLVDDTGGAMRFAAQTSRRMLSDALDEHGAAVKELAGAPEDEHVKKRVARAAAAIQWALKSQNNARLEAMLSIARASKDIAIKHDQLDADPWLLNVQNGTIDLRKGKLRPHDRTDLITKLAPVEYDAIAACHVWARFVSGAMGGSEELVAFLARMVGYSLTGVTREHVLGFFFGGGRNGKSTFLGVIHAMMGDYATPAPRGLLFRGGADRHPTELASLFGARFVTCSEIEQGRAFDEALVKDLTGGDPISARHMREDFWRFVPTHKLFIAGNHKPTVRGDDEGIWRRIRLVPFIVTVEVDAVDKELPEKLKAELPGILSWAVRGCLEWQEKGLSEPKEVIEATKEYRDESDPLSEFFALKCVFEESARVPRAWLRNAYDEYCRDNAIKSALGARAFASALKKHGVKDGGTMRIVSKPTPVDAWTGIRLRGEDEPVKGDSEKKGPGSHSFSKRIPPVEQNRENDLRNHYRPTEVDEGGEETFADYVRKVIQ